MNQKEKKALLLFLFLAFVIPLVCIKIDEAMQNENLSILCFGIQAASPSIAAIFSVVLLGKGAGLKEFFHHLFTPSLTFFQGLKAFVLPFLFMSITYLICAFTLQEWLVPMKISGTKWLILGWALIAEEWGWRGFLQPLLGKVGKQNYVAISVGIIWFFWHYHYLIIGTFNAPILLFFLTCILESYIYLWLSKTGKGNVTSAMLFHFSYNLWINIFCISPSMRQGSIVAYAILMLIEFGYLIFISRGKQQKRFST